MSRIADRVVNIQFNDTGLDKLLDRQKQMRDAAKATYEEQAKILETMKSSGGETKDIEAKKAEVKKLKQEFDTLDKTVKQNNIDFNTIRSAIENIEELGPRAINKLSSSISRLTKNSTTFTKEAQEKIRALGASVKEVSDAISKGFQKGVVKLTEPIPGNATYSELKNIAEQYERNGKVLAQYADDYDAALKTMGARATEAKIKLGEMSGTLQSLSSNASTKDIQEYIRGWQEIANYAGATAKQKSLAEQNIAKGQAKLADQYINITRNPNSFSEKELGDAIKALQDYSKSANLSAISRERLNRAIAEGQAHQQEYERMRQISQMALQLGNNYDNITKLSDDSLRSQERFWQGVVNGADKSSPALAEAQEKLKKVRDEISSRNEATRQDTLKNLDIATVSEIQNAIKATEELRNAQAAGSDEWKRYNKEMQSASEYLRVFTAESKAEQLRQAGDRLGGDTSDIENLKALLNQWKQLEQAEINAGNGAGKYRKEIEELEEKVKKLSAAKARETLSNPLNFSNEEVQKSIKLMEDYAKAMSAKGDTAEYEKATRLIAQARKELEDYNLQSKKMVMAEKMQQINTLSKDALAEQERFWQGVVNGADKSSPALAEAQEKLKQVREQMRVNLSDEVGQKKLLDYKRGDGGSIGDLKENIALLQKFRETINSTDTEKLKEVDDAIRNMREDIKQTKEEIKIAEEYMDSTDEVPFTKNTIADLEKAKKGLEELREQTDITTDEGKKKVAEIDKDLLKIDSTIRSASMSQKRFNEILESPGKVNSLNELKIVYDQLQEEIKQAGISEDEFFRKSEDIKAVKERMEELNHQIEEQGNIFTDIKKKVKELIVYYISLNSIISTIKTSFTGSLELSDKMTNVQKVTNASNKEIKELTDNLQDLDTRTNYRSLMDFAEQAGKLGIYTDYGIQGLQSFVEVGERINATLGEDIGGAAAIANLAKINNIMGVTSQMGEDVGRALDATGSSILNLGNNSAAGYASITNYIGRLGAVGTTAQMTVPQLVALGGTLDALSMPVESGATALSQIISSIQNHTDELAEAAGLSVAKMRELVASGQTYEALNLLLDAMDRGAVTAQGLMDKMGGRSKTSVQIRNTWQLLSANVEMLNKNLGYAQEGFDSVGESIELIDEDSKNYISTLTQQSVMSAEFARVNNNAAGQVERLKNMWQEFLTNSLTVTVFTTLITKLTEFVHWLNNGSKGTATLKAALEAIITTLLIMKFHILSMVKSAAVSFGLMIKHAVKYTAAMLTARKATDATTSSLKRMQKTAIKNWITLLITLVIALGYELYQASKKASKLAKAIAETNEEERQSEIACNALFAALRRVNDGTDERRRLIEQINAQYGKYLGFMLTERDNANMIAAAHDRIIYSLKAEAQLKSQSKIIESVQEQYTEDIKEAQQDIVETLEGVFGTEKSQEFLSDLIKVMTEEIENGNRDINAIYEKAQNKISQKYTLTSYIDDPISGRETYTTNPFWNIQSNNTFSKSPIKKLIEYTINEDKDIQTAIKANNARQTSTQEDFDTASRLANEKLKSAKSIKDSGEIDSRLDEYVKDLDAYVKLMKNFRGRSEDINSELEFVYKELSDYRPKLNERIANSVRESVWGKSDKPYSTWTSERLSAQLSKYDRAEQLVNQGGDWEEAFPDLKVPQGWDAERLREFLYEEATKMRNILQERHDNNNANFQWGGDSSKKKSKEEYEAAIASLDAYYKMRETIIETALNNEEISEEEAQRRKESLEIEHMMKRATLRQDATSKLNDADKKSFESWWAGISELDSVNWERLRKQSAEWGKAYLQKQKLSTEKDLSEIQKIIKEHQKKIQEILQEGDSVKKITEEFRSAMDSLDMIFGLGESEAERTAELGKRRLLQLMDWSRNAYQLTTEDLRRAMEDEKNIYHLWFSQLGEQQEATIQAMLIRLRQYADDMTEAVRTSANETKRIFEKRWSGDIQSNGMTHEKSQEREQRLGETGVSVSNLAQTWGFGGDQTTTNAELNLINLQIEHKREYIELLGQELQAKLLLSQQREEELQRQMDTEASGFNSSDAEHAYLSGIVGNDEYSQEEQEAAKARLIELSNLEMQLAEQRQNTANLQMETNLLLAESETELADLREQQTQKTIEQYKQVFESINAYKDNLDTFAESFGEGIFGSKEDRQNAAKQLLTDLAKTTKNVLQEYLIQLVTKKSIDKMIVAEEQAKDNAIAAQRAKSLADFGANKIAELQVGAATSTAEIQEAIAKATAKETAKEGLIGLAKAAAISLGLNLLLGLALGAINKSKNEVSATTGVSSGKLATGMLTYASGRYPTYADGEYGAGEGSMRDGQRYSVNADDGRRYNAKYTSKLKTGVYHGPHMAVFSERGDEMVIDHPTLTKMPRWMMSSLMQLHQTGHIRMNYEAISSAAQTLSLNRARSFANTGSQHGVRTYADGNMENILQEAGVTGDDEMTVSDVSVTQQGNERMSAALERSNAVISELSSVLKKGIGVNMYGNNGLMKSMKKSQRWEWRNGVKD